MKSKSATKRALLSSAVSLVLCFTMLLGTTFAWFTDSASTAVNTIQSGTLDVVLEYATEYDSAGNPIAWADANGQTLSFKKAANAPDDEKILWEPGCRYELPAIRVGNAGNLHLKYEIAITGIDGSAKLNEAIDWTYNNKPASAFSGFEGTLAPKTASGITYGEEIVIMGEMKKEAGNEYQGLTIDGISITVFATQKDAEFDSFDNKYDENAEIGTLVTTNDELLAAIQDPEILAIRVDGDLTYDWGGDSYGSSKALLMKNKTFIGADNEASITFAGYGSANPITDVTMKNITVKDVTVGDNESSWEHGYLEFGGNLVFEGVDFVNAIAMDSDSAVFKNCTFNSNKDDEYAVWVSGGNTTITDSVFTGTRAIKIHEAYGSDVSSVVVDNCIFDLDLSGKPGVVIGTLNADTSVSITNSTFDCAAGDQGKYIYESDTDVTAFDFSESDNECAVVAAVSTSGELDTAIKGAGATTLLLGSGNYIIPDSAQGKTLTIKGNGDTVVATQDDGSYEGCDYSLDGATVTFENITINTDSTTYTGYARMKGTFNNCTINGTYTLYDDSVFNNCTFNVSGDVYNIWTWGAPNATFNNCTFNSDGKAVLLYGTADTNLTVDGCVFNDNGGLTDLKAAIEIGNDYGKSYTLTVTNTVVNGYEINDKGINTSTTLWANKNSMGTDKLNVIVDGVDVY